MLCLPRLRGTVAGTLSLYTDSEWFADRPARTFRLRRPRLDDPPDCRRDPRAWVLVRFEAGELEHRAVPRALGRFWRSDDEVLRGWWEAGA